MLFALLILPSALLSRAQAQDIPDQAYISGVIGHAQQYTLSCEARSAADWADYWGVNFDETEFLNRLPSSDDPNKGFVGNPNDEWGYIPPASYGVHADPVAEVLRSYGLDAHAGTGLSWDEVRAEVAAGRPVIVWVIGQIWSGSATKYRTEEGNNVLVANNEHTMIVIGYDPNWVHLVDALTGYTVTHSLDDFLNSWSVLGNMAVTGKGNGDDRSGGAQPVLAEGDYVVERGDTLLKIATRLGLFWPDLAAWNAISYPYFIYPGQVLVTSADGEETESNPSEPQAKGEEPYTVQRGDLLADVARRLKVNWVLLARANRIAPPFLLEPGTILHLPTDSDVGEVQVPETYTASRSESLVALAQYYGLDWVRLMEMNTISFPYLLAAGQTIRLK